MRATSWLLRKQRSRSTALFGRMCSLPVPNCLSLVLLRVQPPEPRLSANKGRIFQLRWRRVRRFAFRGIIRGNNNRLHNDGDLHEMQGLNKKTKGGRVEQKRRVGEQWSKQR